MHIASACSPWEESTELLHCALHSNMLTGAESWGGVGAVEGARSGLTGSYHPTSMPCISTRVCAQTESAFLTSIICQKAQATVMINLEVSQPLAFWSVDSQSELSHVTCNKSIRRQFHLFL